MSNYVDFINKLGLYSAILELEELISYYKGACVNNREEECFNNLKNSLDKHMEDKRRILSSNSYMDRDSIKKELLDDWKYLSKSKTLSEYYEIKNQRNKLLYGMIEEIVSKDLDFSSIYLFLIEHNLYNPNMACGVSLEPFYTMLPVNDLELFRAANKKVITDERTDFHILRNGMDAFIYACYCYKDATRDTEKDYWHCYLLWALQGNLSILDSLRFQSVDKIISWDYEPIIYQIFSDRSLNFLVDYLCSEEGILRQCHNSLYPCETQAMAVDFYIRQLNKRGIQSNCLLNLKK